MSVGDCRRLPATAGECPRFRSVPGGGAGGRRGPDGAAVVDARGRGVGAAAGVGGARRRRRGDWRAGIGGRQWVAGIWGTIVG